VYWPGRADRRAADRSHDVPRPVSNSLSSTTPSPVKIGCATWPMDVLEHILAHEAFYRIFDCRRRFLRFVLQPPGMDALQRIRGIRMALQIPLDLRRYVC